MEKTLTPEEWIERYELPGCLESYKDRVRKSGVDLEFYSYMKKYVDYKSSKITVKEAVEVLCNALREDTSEGSYYYSWQANIAMCMYDSFDGSDIELVGDKVLLGICNKGAKNFLNMLIKQ